MKKEADASSRDELRPEYDFASLPGGVRGKYADRYEHGTNLVLLDPEVAQFFKTEKAVNDALRSLMKGHGELAHSK